MHADKNTERSKQREESALEDAARFREQRNAAYARARSSDAGEAKAQSEKVKVGNRCHVYFQALLEHQTKAKEAQDRLDEAEKKKHRGLKKRQLSQGAFLTLAEKAMAARIHQSSRHVI